jgi:signal transduction histidine kinase
MNQDFINEKLNQLREKITNTSLLAITAMSILGQMLATLRVTYTGWSWAFLFQWLSIIVLLFLSIFRNRISTNVKVIILLAVVFNSVISGMIYFGLLAVGVFYSVLIPLFSSFLLKGNKGIWLFGGSVLIILGFGALYSFKILDYKFNTDQYSVKYLSWIMLAFAVSFTTGIVYYVYTAIVNALKSETVDLYSAYSTLLEKDNAMEKKNEEYKSLNEELLKQNERISQINTELEEAKELAEQSEKLKTTFLNNLSHEIRSPMNGIIGFSEIMVEEDLLPEQRREYASIIIQSSKQLLNMVNEIIDISKIQTKQYGVTHSVFNINEIMLSLKQQFEPLALAKNVMFKLKLNIPENQAVLVSDRDKIFRILQNLLYNSVKFTKHGSVLLGNKIEDNEVQIYVVDTGIGIPSSQQHVVFEPFVQVGERTAQEYGGSGLGLAIAKGFAELIDGKIWFESSPGSGTIFYLSFPYNLDSKENNEKQRTKNSSLQGKNILIVDDESINYAYLKTILVKLGVYTLYASNGQEAVDICQLNREIDMVLMDIKMPVMNGIDAANIIKSFRPELPIIAQSAYSISDDRNNSNNTNFNDYVTKPIKKEDLINKIQVYFE